MSLPLHWIDRLFDQLGVVYGDAFLARWAGFDIELVKADWARELSGFALSPDALRYALANLPAYPPTVLEFRALARRAPAQSVVKLPAPFAGIPPNVRAELKRLREPVPQSPDKRDWARRILEKRERGDPVNPTTLRFALEALKGKS